jgi:hypothetical protein
MAVESVSLLASDEVVGWSRIEEGLRIAAPKSKIPSAAIVYKIQMK